MFALLKYSTHTHTHTHTHARARTHARTHTHKQIPSNMHATTHPSAGENIRAAGYKHTLSSKTKLGQNNVPVNLVKDETTTLFG